MACQMTTLSDNLCGLLGLVSIQSRLNGAGRAAADFQCDESAYAGQQVGQEDGDNVRIVLVQ